MAMTSRPGSTAATSLEGSRSSADDGDRPEEGTVVLVAVRQTDGETTDELDAKTLVAVPERALRLGEPGADATRPAEAVPSAADPEAGGEGDRTWLVPGAGEEAGAGDRTLVDDIAEHAAPTVIETHPDLSEVSSSLCEASELETEFFYRFVRAGRRTQRYSLESVRDAGGMGTVLDVLDLDLGRRAAMKILLPVWRERTDLLSRFVSEARITGFLEHPNIIPVHDLGLAREAGLYYTMKLVEGESLHSVLKRLQAHEAMAVAQYTTFALLGIFRKVCDAVAYAHANKLLHLDIKPHNVLQGRYGEVFLIDWGLARACGDPQEEVDPVRRAFLTQLQASTQARGGQISGTPAFMSPEQACGDSAAIDEQTDVFLLGATLYHMFALTPPYTAPDLAGALALARRCEVEPPQQRSPERQIPAEIGRIVMKAMARDKGARYGSVAELASDVDAVMSGRWRPESRKRFAGGELLMRQGEAATESYVILSGRVSVYTESEGERSFLRECRSGEIVGEMALVSHEPRSASVQAMEDTVVAVVTQQDLSEQLDRLPPYMAGMVAMLVSRLRDSSTVHHS